MNEETVRLSLDRNAVLVLADLRGVRSLTHRMADYELALLERLALPAPLELSHPALSLLGILISLQLLKLEALLFCL